MDVVPRRPARRSGLWGLLRRCWPVGAALVAGLVVLASPALQALLVASIWASWLVVAFCALTAQGRGREYGLRLLAWARGAGATALRPVLVQARRLRTRVRGELTAGQRS